MRTTIGLILIAVLSINQSFGQAIGSVWGEVGIPAGEFRRNTDAFGLGFGLGAYAPVDPSGMVFLGADASYEIYGKNVESDGFYELVTNNNMLQLHAVMRIMPQSSHVKPFVEGLFGFKYLYTVDKVKEELGEFESALQANDKPSMEDELGDLLFSVAQVARHLDIDPEQALRKANNKFETRFSKMMKLLSEDGKKPTELSSEELEQYWQKIKKFCN